MPEFLLAFRVSLRFVCSTYKPTRSSPQTVCISFIIDLPYSVPYGPISMEVHFMKITIFNFQRSIIHNICSSESQLCVTYRGPECTRVSGHGRNPRLIHYEHVKLGL